MTLAKVFYGIFMVTVIVGSSMQFIYSGKYGFIEILKILFFNQEIQKPLDFENSLMMGHIPPFLIFIVLFQSLLYYISNTLTF